jgi:hypothetical protein
MIISIIIKMMINMIRKIIKVVALEKIVKQHLIIIYKNIVQLVINKKK